MKLEKLILTLTLLCFGPSAVAAPVLPVWGRSVPTHSRDIDRYRWRLPLLNPEVSLRTDAGSVVVYKPDGYHVSLANWLDGTAIVDISGPGWWDPFELDEDERRWPAEPLSKDPDRPPETAKFFRDLEGALAETAWEVRAAHIEERVVEMMRTSQRSHVGNGKLILTDGTKGDMLYLRTSSEKMELYVSLMPPVDFLEPYTELLRYEDNELKYWEIGAFGEIRNGKARFRWNPAVKREHYEAKGDEGLELIAMLQQRYEVGEGEEFTSVYLEHVRSRVEQWREEQNQKDARHEGRRGKNKILRCYIDM